MLFRVELRKDPSLKATFLIEIFTMQVFQKRLHLNTRKYSGQMRALAFAEFFLTKNAFNF